MPSGLKWTPKRSSSSVALGVNEATSAVAVGSETEGSFADGGTIKLSEVEGTCTEVLLENSMLWSGTLVGISIAGEDIIPFATSELRRLENGFETELAVLDLWEDVLTREEEGGGPGGSGGNTNPVMGAVKMEH